MQQIKTMDDLVKLFSYMVNNISKKETSEEETCPCQNCSCNAENSVNIRDYINKVIFRDRYTIVFWNDGTKSKVKCGKHDTYDPEKGLAMALLKGMLGNRYFRDMTKIIAEFPKIEEPKNKTEANTETKAKKGTSKKEAPKAVEAKTEKSAPKKTAAKSTKKTATKE